VVKFPCPLPRAHQKYFERIIALDTFRAVYSFDARTTKQEIAGVVSRLVLKEKTLTQGK